MAKLSLQDDQLAESLRKSFQLKNGRFPSLKCLVSKRKMPRFSADHLMSLAEQLSQADRCADAARFAVDAAKKLAKELLQSKKSDE